MFSLEQADMSGTPSHLGDNEQRRYKCKERMCPSGWPKSHQFDGRTALSVKSHIKVQALPLIPDTLCAWLCARAHCAVSEMKIIDTKSTRVICVVYTSSIMWAIVHRSSAELCQGGWVSTSASVGTQDTKALGKEHQRRPSGQCQPYDCCEIEKMLTCQQVQMLNWGQIDWAH